MSQSNVLLVSSGGGHWKQLLRLASGLEHRELTFVTTSGDVERDVFGARFRTVWDCNRDQLTRLLVCTMQLIYIVVTTRPSVIISTGAAPGYLALRIGRLFGARTMFVDSFANAEALSMSAQLSVGCADVTLTQWPHLAERQGAQYGGSVL